MLVNKMAAKPKPVRVEKIKESDPIYNVLRDMVALHPNLQSAKIQLVWNFGWKVDRDDKLILGKAKKVSDLEKEYLNADFVIQLNHEAINHVEWSEPKTK